MNAASNKQPANPMTSWLVVVLAVGLVGGIVGYQLWAGKPEMEEANLQIQPMTQAQRMAAMNSLRDEDLVIGVEIEGKAKAYALSAVHAPDKHVHNGMQGDRPVTVTFCDLADCVQVFTQAGEGKPLGVKIEHGASKDRKMVIRVDDHLFHQSTLEPADMTAGKFPLQSVPFIRTTWGEWRKQYPNTELFTGNSN